MLYWGFESAPKNLGRRRFELSKARSDCVIRVYQELFVASLKKELIVKRRLVLSVTILWFASLAFAGCASKVSQSAKQSTDDASETARTASQQLVKPNKSSVRSRVDRARKRLESSKAGRLVWKSIRAHGGLETWYSNGPLHFRYTYHPLGARSVRDTFQTVDTWAARARHEMATDRSKQYGWDGEKAWYRPADWKPPHHVAFWSLTPYYFVAMPFVLSDPGVELEYKGRAELDGQPCDLIHVTFASGTGQSPDDYYYIYLDRDSHKLTALRYIVAYDEFFPEGGHSPEKLMTYDGRQRVEGIEFAESYRFFKWDPDKKTDGKKVTMAKLRDVEFKPEIPEAFFDMPNGAGLWKKLEGNR